MPKPSLTARLESDEEFRKNMRKLVQDFVTNARTTLDYYTADFDAAHDALQCYATLTKEDYVKLAKGHPRRFILPMTATHVHTMTTYIASVLFGGDSPHRVDAGSGDSDAPSRVMNELLKWNAQQHPEGMYQLGWLWIENALTYNRGVFYDCYESIYKTKWENVDTPALDDEGNSITDPETGEPQTTQEPQKVKTRVGGYCRISIVSPYDFYIDPLVPLYKFQTGRFAGHRLNVSWEELQRRSLLESDDPLYLSPKAVTDLKKKPSKSLAYPTASTATGPTGQDLISRTAYERGKVATPVDSRADAKDPGVVDFVELWVKLVPKDYDIDDRTEAELFQVILGNDREVLAVNESTYEHGMFPYSVGEPRPSPFYQYSQSWVMLLKNVQDYVDYLKNRHQEAVTRTVGNVFMARSHLIDIQDFEDPDKEGKFISILPEADNIDMNNIIKQVPVVDTTAGFMAEMKGFVNFAESTTGATQQLQGQIGTDATATEVSSTMNSATGRLGAMARLLSVQAIVPQCKRIVSNFQQFLDTELLRRVEGEDLLDMTEGAPTEIKISPDTIQGSFDFRPHDGTMPGADGKKVAALSRALEASTSHPEIFAPGPGNINPRRIYLDLFRVSGMDVERYRYRPEELQQIAAAAAQQAANQQPPPAKPMNSSMAITAKIEQLTPEERYLAFNKVGIDEPAPLSHPGPHNAAPDAGPAPAPGMTPGPKPAVPGLGPASLPSASPPQVRPSNV